MTFDVLSDGKAVLESTVEEYEQYKERAFTIRKTNFPDTIFCYSPTGYPYKIKDHQHVNKDAFVSLSVTGTACALKCAHCNGRLLLGMESTLTPEDLYERCVEIKRNDGRGILVSGGSDSEGKVPLLRFGKVLSKIKKELDLQVVVHTGIVDQDTVEMLARTGIDAAMLDVIGDEQTAQTVYHLQEGPQKIEKSLELLTDNGIPITPHIMVGMNYGKIRGELEALQMALDYDPIALVIIVLSPQRKTAMEGIEPPSPKTVARVLTISRLAAEEIPLLLGCARPIGPHKVETDIEGIDSGVNGIAYISQEGVDYARKLGLEPVFRDECCSLAFMHFE